MNNQIMKLEDDASVMPPPPPPRPNLLEQEVESLQRCLQNAMLKTGQVYAFYGDTRRLGIAKYANSPPRALASSLGRDLEKYDQLCDTIESNLLRAIAVLQRDLRREEKREEALRLQAEAQKKADDAILETQPADDFQFAEPAPPSSVEFLPTNPRNSPTHPGGPTNVRRPSAISISSLQRPSLPLKLDLSSSSMRMTSEEGSGMYTSGLTSPVTLAPKSARPIGPNEFPEEFMAAFTNPVDHPVIDLTLAESDDHQIKTGMDPTVGDSSDKPIELDLDMDMDMTMNHIFGDNSQAPGGSSLPARVDNMFSMTETEGADNKTTKETDFINLFATLSNGSINAPPNMRDPDSSATTEVPSPATLLDTGFPQHLNTSTSLEDATSLPGTDQSFDISGLGDLGDLDTFNSTSGFSISDMDVFLGMSTGSGGGVNSNENAEKPAALPEQPTTA
ncbi:hypothetical protein P691DRAFT_780306 [Macrolepiota fuliginosa MF-IS2]|uniref:Uncharacterized protein n=1 Tax=Macrolepiota fuliginosa MF-IS2 TaxID=1400762 RepID=A0A9P5XQA2_9AGAR|nr:hypothetical protein P691DRAFT_780306 [Macrolepiota fuliginosa MF-IS2]